MDEDERPEFENTLQPGELYRLSWGFYLLVAVGGLIWLGLAGEPGFDGRLVNQLWWQDVLIGAAAGVGLAGAWQILRSFVTPMRRLEEVFGQMIGPLDASEVFALAVMSGIAEEIFFRGAMQFSWGPLWATLAFALMHTGPGRVFLAWTLFAAVAGALFAALTWWRGTVVAAATAHLAVNWINLSRLISRVHPAEEPAA